MFKILFTCSLLAIPVVLISVCLALIVACFMAISLLINPMFKLMDNSINQFTKPVKFNPYGRE
ncbi:hypothetical protein GO730_05630 [Spirosoma sp. HMF3257]|uniref:Uncharacterized protein n=1 Tax=Spirosoma telluris TaxID=2183553 RepID=A0A327NIW3_9BACT|nr:hypothetical protein [Spirosoma telluris]RAI73956.1 hypothetical protein HMF3257_05590 [Spirosoma telluris]